MGKTEGDPILMAVFGDETAPIVYSGDGDSYIQKILDLGERKVLASLARNGRLDPEAIAAIIIGDMLIAGNEACNDLWLRRLKLRVTQRQELMNVYRYVRDDEVKALHDELIRKLERVQELGQKKDQ